MIAWQTGGLPGALTEDEMNTKFYIRGITSFQSSANSDPLILIDGVESSKLELSRLVVEDIESFSVLKDASATAMYGARGANGVILVTTKKGEEGSVYTTARYEVVYTLPSSPFLVEEGSGSKPPDKRNRCGRPYYIHENVQPGHYGTFQCRSTQI